MTVWRRVKELCGWGLLAVEAVLEEAEELAGGAAGVGEGGEGTVIIDVAGGWREGVGRVDETHGPGFELAFDDDGAREGAGGGVAGIFEDGGEDAVDALVGTFENLEEGTAVIEEHAGDAEVGVAGAGFGEEQLEGFRAEGFGGGAGVDELNQRDLLCFGQGTA